MQIILDIQYSYNQHAQILKNIYNRSFYSASQNHLVKSDVVNIREMQHDSSYDL